ncbi:SnoaL-domain-containing protein [Hypoxylon crocopeplum]|nr:SnoaL-domain-containing protein [Hypoxylon crocopeplum]
MADIEATYRSIVQCINEQRWDDLPRYMHSHFAKDGQDCTPESYAAEMKAIGDVELSVDALTVDHDASQQRLAATLLVKRKPAPSDETGAEFTGRAVSFMEQQFNWFTDGKLSKTLTLADRDEIQRQLVDPAASYTPDLITSLDQHQPPPPQPSASSHGKQLSTRELEDTYRAYIACINAQTMESCLPSFCHAQVIHNTKALTLDGYRLMIQEAFTAIPDLSFGLHTVVADERTQRVAARLEFAGTPEGELAGAAPTPTAGDGRRRAVAFCEHVTYRFDHGRIARVWSIIDWPTYRAQLAEQR